MTKKKFSQVFVNDTIEKLNDKAALIEEELQGIDSSISELREGIETARQRCQEAALRQKREERQKWADRLHRREEDLKDKKERRQSLQRNLESVRERRKKERTQLKEELLRELKEMVVEERGMEGV